MVTPLTFDNPLKFGLDSCHNIKVRHTFLHREREHPKRHANHATHTRTSIIREGPPTSLARAGASPVVGGRMKAQRQRFSAPIEVRHRHGVYAICVCKRQFNEMNVNCDCKRQF